jgi:hypothetical protein
MTPENLTEVMRRLNEAAEVLKSAALAAERNPATKSISIRLFKMSDEAEGYGQYIGAYFQPTGKRN